MSKEQPIDNIEIDNVDDDSDADSVIIENETSELVQLGILEPLDNNTNLNRYHFPSKCGGKPVLFYYLNIFRLF